MAKAFLTVPEVSELIRHTPQTVRKMAKRGDLPGAQMVGSKWLIHKDTFLASLGLHDIEDAT